MKKIRLATSIEKLLRLVLLSFALTVTITGTASASSDTWTGSSSTVWNNTTGGNWSTGAAPTSSDIAIFASPATTNQPVIGNSAVTAGAIQFATSGYTITSTGGTGSGYTLTIGGDLQTVGDNTSDVGIDASALSSGTDTISVANLKTTAAQTWLVGTGATLEISSVIAIASSSPVTMGDLNSSSYSGTLKLDGSSNNGSFYGSVNSGTVILDKTGTAYAVVGTDLTINGGLVQVATGADSTQFQSSRGIALAGGEFDLNGVSQTMAHVTNVSGEVANSSLLTNSSSVAATLTTTSSDKIYGSVTGNLALTETGGYIWFFQTGSTYSGATTLSGGNYINAEAGSVLSPNSAFVLNNTSLPSGNSGNYALLMSGNESVGSLTDTGGTPGDNNVFLDTHTLTTGNDNTSTSYASILSGTGALTKVGTGNFTLTGANSYSGTTSVNGGRIAIGANNTLPSASNVVLNGGGLTFSGSGLSQGTTTTAGLGTLTVNSGNGVLDYAGGSNLLHFADSSGTNWTGTLSIYDWNASTDALYVGTTSGALTTAQLADISFYSDTGTRLLGGAQINSLGDVTSVSAVPEPSTYALLLGGLLFLGLMRSWKFDQRTSDISLDA